MNFGILQIQGIHEQPARKREFFKTVTLIIISAEVYSRYDDLHEILLSFYRELCIILSYMLSLYPKIMNLMIQELKYREAKRIF